MRDAIAGIDCQRQAKGGERAEYQTEFCAGLAVLDGHSPLPPDPDLTGELSLAQLELAASVANDQAEV